MLSALNWVLTLPGMTIVCGDSHTSTHGAFGTIAFGIGTSQVEQVFATQCLLQYKPKTMKIENQWGFGKRRRFKRYHFIHYFKNIFFWWNGILCRICWLRDSITFDGSEDDYLQYEY